MTKFLFQSEKIVGVDRVVDNTMTLESTQDSDKWLRLCKIVFFCHYKNFSGNNSAKYNEGM